jgi:hypothetical protein
MAKTVTARTQTFQKFPKTSFCPRRKKKVETVLATKGPQGETIARRAHEIKDKTVVVDLNHPLAGKTRRESYGHQGSIHAQLNLALPSLIDLTSPHIVLAILDRNFAGTITEPLRV